MPGTRLYSVELRTADWSRLVGWYRDVVGLRVAVRMTGRQYALLTGDEGRLAILGRSDAASAERRWSLAFETADLEAVRERLTAAGVAVVAAESESESYRELTVDDPDGNRIRFFTWAR